MQYLWYIDNITIIRTSNDLSDDSIRTIYLNS